MLAPLPSYTKMATTLHVLAFGPARARLGTDRLDLVCVEPISTDALWTQLLARHPELETLRPTVRLARQGEFLAPDALLHPGDEIALIPPVSGG